MADKAIPEIKVFYSGPIVSAGVSFDAGGTRYFTGRPCAKGHVAQRMISNGSCVECLNRKTAYRRTKEWRKANPGARAIEAAKYRLAHPDKVSATAKRYRDRHLPEVRERDRLNQARMRAANPDAALRRRLAFEAKKEAHLIDVAGRPRQKACELCGEQSKTVFDHCHLSGKFRGWLCDRCNRTLGQVKDSPDLLRLMANYLEKHRDQAYDQTPQGTPESEVRWP